MRRNLTPPYPPFPPFLLPGRFFFFPFFSSIDEGGVAGVINLFPFFLFLFFLALEEVSFPFPPSPLRINGIATYIDGARGPSIYSVCLLISSPFFPSPLFSPCRIFLSPSPFCSRHEAGRLFTAAMGGGSNGVFFSFREPPSFLFPPF